LSSRGEEYTGFNIDASTPEEKQWKEQVQEINDLIKHANKHRQRFNSLLPPPGLPDLKCVDTRLRGKEYIRSRASHEIGL